MTTTDTARLGEEVGLERVFRDRGPALWRSLFLATGNREIASDAVAEAFAQALRRGSQLKRPEAWIWRAAFRIARGEMKRWKDRWPEIDSVYRTDDRLFEIGEALRQLTPHQRASVVLADYAGYSHREIATILGSSVSAVAVHVFRGRRRLRALLEEDDD